MTAKIIPDMTVLSETLLIPLWAKAVEQEREERLLTDPEAPRMLAQIDYDFSKFKNIVMSQVGCCGRAQIFDNEAQKFIAAHPDAVVVQGDTTSAFAAALHDSSALAVPKSPPGTTLTCRKSSPCAASSCRKAQTTTSPFPCLTKAG